MTAKEAESIILGTNKKEGFRVAFEEVKGSRLLAGYFPEHNEPPLKTEERAWELAKDFAKKTRGRFINIYVVDTYYCPVPDYRKNLIENR